MKRVLSILPWVLCVVFAGLYGSAMHDRTNGADGRENRVAVVDSLRQRLADAEIAQFAAEEKHKQAERALNDLFASRDDARRAYEAQKASSDEAIAQKVEAFRQSKAKDLALEGQRTALAGEEQQRRLAEARADSIDAQKRMTDLVNNRLQASKVAQNSMAIKGDQRLRGLMAVEALRGMEASGGDVNKEEVVRALQSALEELERTAPVGVQRLGAGPRAMYMAGAELRALGNDGLLLGIDPSTWTKRTLVDLSRRAGPNGGHAFLSGGFILTADRERKLAISSAADGSLIAGTDRTSHTDEITAMAAFAGGSGLVSGDLTGRIVVWKVEGAGLHMVNEHTVGGAIGALVLDPGSGLVVALNGTENISLFGKDGARTAVALSDADRARCAIAGTTGEILIGTHQGAVFALRPGDRDLRRIHNGSGRRVEALAVLPGEGRTLAVVDGVGNLTVLDRRKTGLTDFQIRLSGIPNALVFGGDDVLYLAFEDHTVRRVFTNTRSMADRVCELAGRPWTQEEWAKHIGEGAPLNTCAVP